MKTPMQMAFEYCDNAPISWFDRLFVSLEQIRIGAFKSGYKAAQPQWISVKDRLPKKDHNVLWYNPTLLKPMDVHPISPLWNGSLKHNTYTHWMPLPKPPEDK